jgi:hypothetical protein
MIRRIRLSNVREVEMSTLLSLPERPWVSVFMSVCVRAIQRVHHEYGRWSVGPHWIMDRLKSHRMNKGRGIELADERTVCAAVTQEFLASSAVAGIWKERKRNEIRFFDIDREAPYQSSGRQKADLFIKKFVPRRPRRKRSQIQLRVVRWPSFVEAKRARLWYPALSKKRQRFGPSQLPAIRRDIEKLRREIRYRTKNRRPQIYGHILVWGIYSDGKKGDSPTDLLKALQRTDQNLELHSVRSIPISWTQENRDAFEIPKVTMVLWLLLVEVHVRAPNRLLHWTAAARRKH